MFSKNKYKFIATLAYIVLLSGCQGVKDSFEGKKKNNSDEFLVEKKNPLVLPPEFEALPEPKTLKTNKDIKEELSIKKIIGQKSTKIKKSSPTKSYDTIEKSILDKIK